MVLAGETLSDFAGDDGRVFGGLRGRAEYELMIKELCNAWANLIGAVAHNENVGAPTITALFDLVYNFLERRYGRYVIILSKGRLREEVLANVAHQLVELRLYFATFQRNLSDRCTRKPYGELAQLAGSRSPGTSASSARPCAPCSTWTTAPRAPCLQQRSPMAAAGAAIQGRQRLRPPGASSASPSRTAVLATSRPRRPRSPPRPTRVAPVRAGGPAFRTIAPLRRRTTPRRARPTPLPATTPSCPHLGAPGGAATPARSLVGPRPRPRLLDP
jgi:hypothetical protein